MQHQLLYTGSSSPICQPEERIPFSCFTDVRIASYSRLYFPLHYRLYHSLFASSSPPTIVLAHQCHSTCVVAVLRADRATPLPTSSRYWCSPPWYLMRQQLLLAHSIAPSYSPTIHSFFLRLPSTSILRAIVSPVLRSHESYPHAW